MIGLTINVTEPEYIEAQSLYHRASRHKRIRVRGQLAVICLLSIWGVISLAWKAQLGFNFLMALLAPAWFILAILSGLFKKSRQYSAYKLAAVTLNGVQVENRRSWLSMARGRSVKRNGLLARLHGVDGNIEHLRPDSGRASLYIAEICIQSRG